MMVDISSLKSFDTETLKNHIDNLPCPLRDLILLDYDGYVQLTVICNKRSVFNDSSTWSQSGHRELWNKANNLTMGYEEMSPLNVPWNPTETPEPDANIMAFRYLDRIIHINFAEDTVTKHWTSETKKINHHGAMNIWNCFSEGNQGLSRIQPFMLA